LVISYIH